MKIPNIVLNSIVKYLKVARTETQAPTLGLTTQESLMPKGVQKILERMNVRTSKIVSVI